MFTLSSRTVGALHRVLVLALVAPALLLVTLAALPALAVMPFLSGGTDRCVSLLRAHSTYARTLLAGSRGR